MRKNTPNFCRRLWGIAVLLTVLILLSACDTLIKPVFPPALSETVGTDRTTGPADLPDEPSRDTDEPSPPETHPDGTKETESAGTESDTASESVCDHAPTVIPAVEPTCSKSGMTEGSACALCGELLKAPAELSPVGHAYSPAQDFRCAFCGEQAVCPLPVIVPSGTVEVSWGDTLTLTWSHAEESPFPTAYMVFCTDGQGRTVELWDGWKTETACELPCVRDGETLTLTVCGCFTGDGEPVEATRSVSEPLTVVIRARETLESPGFIAGNRLTVPVGRDATIVWSPVNPENPENGQIMYALTLVGPDGSERDLSAISETVCTIPAEQLREVGSYTLRIIARDAAETYRESAPATLLISVTANAPAGEEDFTNPLRYASDYYYNYLGTCPKGEKLQSYYRVIDETMADFHRSGANAESVEVTGGKIHYYAAKLNFSYFGLTLEEAKSVRQLYVYDHPLYYWIGNVFVYTSTSLYLCVDPDYAEGSVRDARNAMIYDGIAAMAEGLTAEASPYNLALAYYERLLDHADYAYEEDGETPQDDLWAHSIVGVFDPDKRAVVCEGFAKAYSLLLNYHGVENISVPGMSRGVGHLWNLLRLENGEWYWCDITWDDSTHSPLGTDYKYFCVTDTQDVLFYYVRDGIEAGKDYTFSGSSTFMDDHTVQWDGISLDMSRAIPARADMPYGSDGMTLRETFTVDGMTYALTGYGKVQLVAAESGRSLTVSETVTYLEVTYTVTSIGLINGEGVFMTGRLLPLFTTSVYVPKTISYIWDGALSGLLVNVTVDPENSWYVSHNGSVKPRTP